MSKQSLPLGRRIYKIALSASIILAGICLIVGCVFIYFNGNGYSRSIVADTFSKIYIPIILCSILIIGDIIWELISPSTPNQKTFRKKLENTKTQMQNNKKYLTLKFIVLGFAITAFIVGFFMGGYADVLTKAINICTECIGLG